MKTFNLPIGENANKTSKNNGLFLYLFALGMENEENTSVLQNIAKINIVESKRFSMDTNINPTLCLVV